MKKYFVISAAILCLICIHYFSHRHFTVVFKDVRPFDGNINVYYKGVLVGKATDKYHNKDIQKTNVKIILNNRKLKLPLNTKAVLKKRIQNDKEIDYIELVYPEVPSSKLISEYSHIHGHSTTDIKEFLKNQNIEDLEQIKANLLNASGNLNATVEALVNLLILLQDILQENRENFKSASGNIKETTQNINKFTKKIDNIIVEEQWNNTLYNIEHSTGGLHNFARNINDIVEKSDKTIPKTLQNTNEITENLNSITCGIRNTLSKKFGGLRLFFGQVINK